MSKMNTQKFADSGAFAVGGVVGAMSSRVIADQLKGMLKKENENEPKKGMSIATHGGLAVLGILGVAFANPKDTVGKGLQGLGVGVASTQIVECLKVALTPKDKEMEKGILKTALGSADPQTIVIESPAYNGYQTDYYPYEDIDNQYVTQMPFEDGTQVFLSGADVFTAV